MVQGVANNVRPLANGIGASAGLPQFPNMQSRAFASRDEAVQQGKASLAGKPTGSYAIIAQDAQGRFHLSQPIDKAQVFGRGDKADQASRAFDNQFASQFPGGRITDYVRNSGGLLGPILGPDRIIVR